MPHRLQNRATEWSLQRTVEPVVEPLTVVDAKLHLRVDHPDEDQLISELISVARHQAELFQLRAYLTQTWELQLDAFPAGNTIRMPRPPLQSVVSITYIDQDQTQKTLDTATYTVDTASEPGRVVLNPGSDWPVTAEVPGAVTVQYVAGYGDTAADVPDNIVAAMKLFVGHLYENREAITVGTGPTFALAFGPEYLLWPDRVLEFDPLGGM